MLMQGGLQGYGIGQYASNILNLSKSITVVLEMIYNMQQTSEIAKILLNIPDIVKEYRQEFWPIPLPWRIMMII